MAGNFKHHHLMNLTKKEILEKGYKFPIDWHYSYLLRGVKNKSVYCKTNNLEHIPDDATHVEIGIGTARTHIFQLKA